MSEKCEECVPVGGLVDRLGVTVHWPAGDPFHPVDAVVIFRGVDKDGRTALRAGWPEGMDWITRRGMIEVARDQEVTSPEWDCDDDD